MPRSLLQALAAVTALAALLRFPTLDVQSFWLDEAVTAHLVRPDLGGMLSAIPDSESTPPLYYVLAWLWSKLFGPWEVGLRSLSALIGTATVPVVYAIGARAAGERVGLAAALLAAVNPLLVWYSQEARSYALLVLLTALALLLFLRLLDGEARRRDLLLWGLSAALALATHYFALFVLLPQALWLLRRRGLRDSAIALALALVAGLALLPLAIDQASNRFADFIEGTSLLTRIAQVPKQLLVAFDAPLEPLAIALGLGLAALGAWLAVTRTDARERRGLPPLLVVAGAGVGIPLLLAVFGVDYLITRNVIPVAVPLLVLLAAGFAAPRAGRAGTAGLAALCALSVALVIAVAVEPLYQRDDWRGIAEAIGPAEQPRGIAVTPFNGRIPLALYLEGTSRYPENGDSVLEIVGIGVAEHSAGQEAEPPRPPEGYGINGFNPAEERLEDTYTLVRVRADFARGVPRNLLGLMLLTRGRGELLRQEPNP